jgi:hypothetical protein
MYEIFLVMFKQIVTNEVAINMVTPITCIISLWVFLGVLKQYKVSWPCLQTQLMFNVKPFLAQFSCDLSFAILIFSLFDVFVTLSLGLWLK